MIEISTSILTVEKGSESEIFFALEKAKTDYFHIDVMDGKFVDNKTIEELQERGAKVFMSDDGMVGVAVMNDNNIVGVFKNGQFNQKGVSEEMIYTARD